MLGKKNDKTAYKRVQPTNVTDGMICPLFWKMGTLHVEEVKDNSVCTRGYAAHYNGVIGRKSVLDLQRIGKDLPEHKTKNGAQGKDLKAAMVN